MLGETANVSLVLTNERDLLQNRGWRLLLSLLGALQDNKSLLTVVPDADVGRWTLDLHTNAPGRPPFHFCTGGTRTRRPETQLEFQTFCKFRSRCFTSRIVCAPPPSVAKCTSLSAPLPSAQHAVHVRFCTCKLTQECKFLFSALPSVAFSSPPSTSPPFEVFSQSSF